jgi:hypothetical protein
MRYDRARVSLDRHATYIVATFVAGARRRPHPPALDQRYRSRAGLGSGGEGNMRLGRDGQVGEGVWSGCWFWSWNGSRGCWLKMRRCGGCVRRCRGRGMRFIGW